jgi:hypothetical protein
MRFGYEIAFSNRSGSLSSAVSSLLSIEDGVKKPAAQARTKLACAAGFEEKTLA